MRAIRKNECRTRISGTDAMLCLVGVQVTLGLLGKDQRVLAFVFFRHDDLRSAGGFQMGRLKQLALGEERGAS